MEGMPEDLIHVSHVELGRDQIHLTEPITDAEKYDKDHDRGADDGKTTGQIGSRTHDDVWLRDLDSNQDTRLQRAVSYR